MNIFTVLAMVAFTVVGFATPVSAQMEDYVEAPAEIMVDESGAAITIGISNPGEDGLEIVLSTGDAFEITSFTGDGCVENEGDGTFALTCEPTEFWQTTATIVPTEATSQQLAVEGTLTTSFDVPFSFTGETSLIWEHPNPEEIPPAEEPNAGAGEDEEVLDPPLCNGEVVTVFVTNGDLPTDESDVILGTEGPDVINAGAGNDIICGLGGDDIINAGKGGDMVLAGAGADVVQAGQGRDTVYGQGGDDTIVGGKGKDTLIGGAGNDDIRGNDGTDLLDGSKGRDELRGGQGADLIRGGSGADILHGGTRPDMLDGERGIDTYDGGAGLDICTVDREGNTEHTDSCEATE